MQKTSPPTPQNESLCPPEYRPLYARDIAAWMGLDPDSKAHRQIALAEMRASGLSYTRASSRMTYVLAGEWEAWWVDDSRRATQPRRGRSEPIIASKKREKLPEKLMPRRVTVR